MEIPRKIFKMYDIRGLVDTEITPDLAEAVGKAFATLLSREVPAKRLTIAVGRDMRKSSPSYQARLMDGIRATGADVIDIGLVSTPAFYFGVGHTKADGGVMVSASHNPAAYNGFKMTRANAVPVSGESGIQTLADMIEQGDLVMADTPGTITTVDKIPSLAAEAEIAFVADAPVKRFKIVADAANGMGAQYLDELFKQVDTDVTRMYWDFDGSFPNHEADPFKEENTADLRREVVALHADIGITPDGDGDRIFFVDEKGETVEPAIVRGLIAQIMLRRNPGATICYDIRPGKITDDMIREAGGVPCVTRVGHSLIKEKMREVGAVFAGESSGHFYYAFPSGYYEGPVAVALMLLQEMTRLNKPLSEIVAPLKRYVHSGEINFKVADKQAAIESIKQKYADGVLQEIDGITITYPTFWFNVRASNTEPLLRLNLEAVDQKIMQEKRDEISMFMI